MAKYEIKDGVGIIPEGTIEIESRAFEKCTELTSIVIPDSVKVIGDHAFLACTGLTSIIFGNSVAVIGESAFWDCTSLANVIIPDSVTKVEAKAFLGCSGITSVVIGNSVTTIGNKAFKCCSALTSIVIPDSVTKIGEGAFAGCTGLKRAVISNSVMEIEEETFKSCMSLTSVVIPDSVKVIKGWAFMDCVDLTSIVIPNSVTEILYDAFYRCMSLMSIVIPDSVMLIGRGAFSGCTDLKSVILPNSVQVIGEYAFYNCECLKAIIVPAKKRKYYEKRLPKNMHDFILETSPEKQTFNFNGETYKDKGRLCHDIVKYYVEQNPKVALTSLQDVFNTADHTFVTTPEMALATVNSRGEAGGNYYMEEEDQISIKDGKVVVWNYWPKKYFNPFMKRVKTLGWYSETKKDGKSDKNGESDKETYLYHPGYEYDRYDILEALEDGYTDDIERDIDHICGMVAAGEEHVEVVHSIDELRPGIYIKDAEKLLYAYVFDGCIAWEYIEKKEQKSNPKGKRYTVSYVCRPYSVQMFKVDETMKRRCLEAAVKDELGDLWWEYEDNDESTFFCPDYDYEWEVLTRDRRMDLSVYDEDDNEIFHTNDMNDLCGQQDKDGNFSDFEGLPDGDYLIRFDTIKGSAWEGTFEAEEFDPKKLSFAKSSELDANFPLIENDVMEVSCLCYDGELMDDLEFISDNGSYGPDICLYNCKDKNKWEEIKP